MADIPKRSYNITALQRVRRKRGRIRSHGYIERAPHALLTSTFLVKARFRYSLT